MMRGVLALLGILLAGAAHAQTYGPGPASNPVTNAGTSATTAGAVQGVTGGVAFPTNNYYWNGSAWVQQGAPVGGSSGAPGYQSILCGGSVVSTSNPCPIAISEPSNGTLNVTGNGALLTVQASLWGYKEAHATLTAVGTGGSIAGQYSDDGVNWLNSTRCHRDSDGFAQSTLTTLNSGLSCPIQGAYFQWVMSSLASGTYTVAFSFKVSQVSSTSVFTTPQPLATGGCSTWYHLAGGSAATTNSTLASTAASHMLCNAVLINTNATLAYFRLYDSGSAPTCSSATGAKAAIPLPQNVPVSINYAMGAFFNSGIGYCITGGGADNDNTSATTGVYVTMNWQ